MPLLSFYTREQNTQETHPENGLHRLQRVRNDGGNRFGNRADDEDLGRWQLGGGEKKKTCEKFTSLNVWARLCLVT